MIAAARDPFRIPKQSASCKADSANTAGREIRIQMRVAEDKQTNNKPARAQYLRNNLADLFCSNLGQSEKFAMEFELYQDLSRNGPASIES